MSRRILALLAAVAVAAAAIAWFVLPGRREPLNVIVLVVDTLRADHLGIYGYHRPTSPNIDRFFGEGTVFFNARAQASCTFPSVNSILTSRYPSAFLQQPDKKMGIPDDIVSVAEIFRQHGYATIAASASPIVRTTGTKYNNHGGFGRGFDVFDEQCVWRDARCINEKIVASLEGKSEPFFLYLHYMDPHDPYRPPGWYRRRYAVDYEGLDFVVSGNPNPIADAIHWNKPMPEYSPRDLQHLIDLYDDEITYFDGELAVLMGDLATRGLLDRTAIVIASDHGEQFLEHGYMKHCYTLYDTDIRTPLAFRIPGTPENQIIQKPVQNVDIVPTLLDYAGIDHRNYGFDGRSLRPLIEGDDDGDEPTYAFAMQGARRSVTDEHFKLGYDARKREFGLHDLQGDPAERHDVLREHSEAFLRLQGALLSWETQVAQGKTANELLRAGEEVQERLRALGYLQGSQAEAR